jgi:limonene-1,2-epoxide hydrolase
MAAPRQVVQEFVDTFVDAWPVGDAARVASLFSDEASYHNGPLEPVHGRGAIRATLAEFMTMGGEVSVDMLNVLADEHVVMTERIDHFLVNGRTFSLPVMGVFEVAEDKITAWRDYFDLGQFTSLLQANG